MFNNVVLDVFIGLVFIYLLYSLLATIVQELIATQLDFRAKVLEKAIMRMLEDGKTTSKYRFLDRAKGFFQMFSRTNRLKNKKFATAFYVHPLIKYLAEDNWFSKPGYLSGKNFSKILLDVLNGMDSDEPANDLMRIQQTIRTGKISIPDEIGQDTKHPANEALHFHRSKTQLQGTIDINPETKLFLKNLLNEAQGDIEKFRTKLEQWFDDTMERTTGWYKRYTQTILLILGFVIAVGFNVDSIAIAKKLARDPKLREQMVLAATTYVDKQNQLGSQLQQLKNDTTPQGVATYQRLGTSYDSLVKKTERLLDSANSLIKNDIGNVTTMMGLGYRCENRHGALMHIFFFFHNDASFLNFIGWFITALAICLGAPFWFDLLNKLTKLRAAGTRIGTEGSSSNAPSGSQVQPVNITVKTHSDEEAAG